MFLLTGAASDTVYDTSRTTARSRAAAVLQSAVIPTLEGLYRCFRGGEDCAGEREIGYLGMVMCYGSKAFSGGPAADRLKPEAVAFIASTQDVYRFITGDLTEDDLVRRNLVYLADRDMVVGSKRVLVSLQ